MPLGTIQQSLRSKRLVEWDQQHVLHGIIPMGFNAGFLIDHYISHPG